MAKKIIDRIKFNHLMDYNNDQVLIDNKIRASNQYKIDVGFISGSVDTSVIIVRLIDGDSVVATSCVDVDEYDFFEERHFYAFDKEILTLRRTNLIGNRSLTIKSEGPKSIGMISVPLNWDRAIEEFVCNKMGIVPGQDINWEDLT